MKKTVLVLTCEHAVNYIPQAYLHLFENQEAILETHFAYDIGAVEIATYIANHFKCDCINASVSRLLIDCNRTLTSAYCFSNFSRSLPLIEKQKLVDDYYFPFRQQAESLIHQHIEQNHQVLHISIHSFTPELNGNLRNAAIGLLYDPKRHAEKEVSRIWRSLLLQQIPAYSTRLNYPYRGSSDGFTRSLRKKYTEKEYLGIELECNQVLLGSANNCSISRSTPMFHGVSAESMNPADTPRCVGIELKRQQTLEDAGTITDLGKSLCESLDELFILLS